MVQLPLGDFHRFSSKEVRQLLHNKFVVILGDSIHRTIYKDLVRFLQDDGLLTDSEVKKKGELTFWHDHRVEGGKQHQETTYREVRQYRTDHHLVRAYFITRIYSDYMESILNDFKDGLSPDLIILSSCVWDLNRYLDYSFCDPLEKAFREYWQNLHSLFQKLRDILPSSCLIIWDTAMSIGPKIKKGGYLKPGMQNKTTPVEILRANFESATVACCYRLDVLDLNYSFRFFEKHLAPDGVHWSRWVHRGITNLLLTHVADAWGVKLEKKSPWHGITWNGNASYQHHSPRYQPPPPLPLCPPWCPPLQLTYTNGQPPVQFYSSQDLSFQHDSISDWGPSSGFFNFEDDHEPQAHQEDVQHGDLHGPVDVVPNGGSGFPLPFPFHDVPNGGWRDHFPLLVADVPNGGWRDHFPLPVADVPDGEWRGHPPLPHRSPRGFWGRRHNGRIMHHKRFYPEHYQPYIYPPNGPRGHPPFQDPPYQ